MSVQSEIDRINGNVASTYTALSEMGATMPETQNSDNLPGTVRTVPTGGGTSVQTDWNQTDETAPDFLKNKPFGEMQGDTLTWEFDIGGLDFENLPGGFMVKVSDSIVNMGDLGNGCIFTMVDEQIPVSFEEIAAIADGVIMISEGFAVCVDDNGVGVEVDVLGESIVFPESGIYTIVEIVEGALYIPGYGKFIKIEKLNEKYLPDTCVEQVVLYISASDEDNWLYKDANYSEKVRSEEMADIASANKRVVLKDEYYMYYEAISVRTDRIVYVRDVSSHSEPEFCKAHTVE